MTQYSSKEKTPVAKIQAADSTSEKKLDRRIRKLIDQVEEQQKVIDRMHRDIVRLRVAINEVSARIK
jgi:polyhydroxyalkanoate synthesis regulator phasin